MGFFFKEKIKTFEENLEDLFEKNLESVGLYPTKDKVLDENLLNSRLVFLNNFYQNCFFSINKTKSSQYNSNDLVFVKKEIEKTKKLIRELSEIQELRKKRAERSA